MAQAPTTSNTQPITTITGAQYLNAQPPKGWRQKSQAFSDPQVRAYIANLKGQIKVYNKKNTFKSDLLKRLILPTMSQHPQLSALRGNGPHPSPQYMKIANKLATGLSHIVVQTSIQNILGGNQPLLQKFNATIQRYNGNFKGWSVAMRMISKQINAWWATNKEGVIGNMTPQMGGFFNTPGARLLLQVEDKNRSYQLSC